MKKLFFCILIILWKFSVVAQEVQYVALDTFPFIKYEADTLVFDKDTSLLGNFFKKMERLIENNEGEISIIQIGGSHIQAGTMSHTIRRNLLLAYPTLISNRGFVFPYSVAPKCNNPIDYRVRKNGEFSLVRNVYKDHNKPLNTSGIAVYTSDTFPEITIQFKDSILKFQTKKLTLVGHSQPSYVVPTIWVDSLEYFPTSIDTILGRYVYDVEFEDSFTLHPNCNGDSLQEFTLHSLILENRKPGITFHSIGVNGASVPAYLRCENFARDLDLFRPDLVIFGIGINDAFDADFNAETFEQNYLQLIQKIQAYNPDCAFIFFTNNDSYKRVARRKYQVNRNATEVQRVMYSLAKQTRGAVFDQFEIMGGMTSMYKWYTHKLAKYDRVHFTNEGYVLMGNLFYNAFLHAMKKYQNSNQSLNIE